MARYTKKEIIHAFPNLSFVKAVRGPTLPSGGSYFYGGVYVHDDTGDMFYIAERKYGDIFREGRSTASQAIREGVAKIAFDERTVLMMRANNIKVVIVRAVSKEGKFEELYYIQTWKITSSPADGYWTRHNFEAQGGANQRYVFLKYFYIKPGKITSLS